MLNKLLKRCMPWMDKGRWYTLVITGTGDDYVIDHDKSDPAFMRMSSYYNDDTKTISLINTYITFMDVKCISNASKGTVITASYRSNRFTAEIKMYEGVGMTPYEGTVLTFYIFGR